MPLCPAIACGIGVDTCGNEVACACPGGSVCTDRVCHVVAPVLLFGDLTSGPRTGWQGGEDAGAAVTVWGRHFGPLELLEVTINGAAAEIVESASFGPEERFDRVTFLVPSDAADGAGVITLHASGLASNTLPFTVRAGRIFYVSRAGSNSAGGSWLDPWATLQHAAATAMPGDIVYALNAVVELGELSLERSGTLELPIAIVAAPGAAAYLGFGGRAATVASAAPAAHWVLSRFTINAAVSCIDARTGFRVVGNSIAATTVSSACVDVTGDGVRILGNEIRVGWASPGPTIRARATAGAPIPESDREIAYNHLSGRSGGSILVASDGAPIGGHFVHDNAIVDQDGPAISFGANVTGENRVFTNVVLRAGRGSMTGGSHAGLRFDLGVGSTARVIAAFNTVVDAGEPDALESGALFVGEGGEVVVTNNAFASDGLPLVAAGSAELTPSDYRNAWLGSDVPSWDTGGVAGFAFFRSETDFRPAFGSGLVDRAVQVENGPTLDFDGYARSAGASADIGAYELVY